MAVAALRQYANEQRYNLAYWGKRRRHRAALPRQRAALGFAVAAGA
jgi:hypothetical protein